MKGTQLALTLDSPAATISIPHPACVSLAPLSLSSSSFKQRQRLRAGALHPGHLLISYVYFTVASQQVRSNCYSHSCVLVFAVRFAAFFSSPLGCCILFVLQAPFHYGVTYVLANLSKLVKMQRLCGERRPMFKQS
jgi:hypothetical protein